MKILLIEDTIGEVLSHSLRSGGYEVTLAEDGEEAWRLLNALDVDFLVADWMVPRLSGVDLVSRIRQSVRMKNLPVLMISARTQKEDVLRAIDAGINGYLAKPFKPVELREKIEQIQRQVSGPLLRHQLKQLCLQQVKLATGDAPTPVVVLGEVANTEAELNQPHRRELAQYLIQVARAIAHTNSQYPQLRLGYALINSTETMVRLVNRRASRGRVKLLLLSTSCRGNAPLVLQMTASALAKDVRAVLVCDQSPTLLPRSYLRALEKLQVEIIHRQDLTPLRIQQLLDDCALRLLGSGEPETVDPKKIGSLALSRIETMEHLPLLPQTQQRLQALADQPSSSLGDWEQRVLADPLALANLLRLPSLARSGPLAPGQHSEDLLPLLGRQQFEEILLRPAGGPAAAALQQTSFPLEDFRRHSLAVGWAAWLLSLSVEPGDYLVDGQAGSFLAFGLPAEVVAKLKQVNLAHRLNLDPEQCYIAGLLHDIGKVALALAHRPFYQLVSEVMDQRNGKVPMAVVEEEVANGLNHPRAGAVLAARWGFDGDLSRVIEFHHRPDPGDALVLLIGLADVIGQAVCPFPAQGGSPVVAALNYPGGLEEIPAFLPMGFFGQSLIQPDGFAELAWAVLPVVSQLVEQTCASGVRILPQPFAGGMTPEKIKSAMRVSPLIRRLFRAA